MSFREFETDTCFVGGRHKSATTKIASVLNSEGSKRLIGHWSICNRKKSMTVSDNTKQSEGLGNFFNKNLAGSSAKVGEKLATKVLRKPCRALENTPNRATAAATRVLKK